MTETLRIQASGIWAWWYPLSGPCPVRGFLRWREWEGTCIAGSCNLCSNRLSHLLLADTLDGHSYCHFIDRFKGPETVGDLPKVTQLVEVDVELKSSCLQSPVLSARSTWSQGFPPGVRRDNCFKLCFLNNVQYEIVEYCPIWKKWFKDLFQYFKHCLWRERWHCKVVRRTLLEV